MPGVVYNGFTSVRTLTQGTTTTLETEIVYKSLPRSPSFSSSPIATTTTFPPSLTSSVSLPVASSSFDPVVVNNTSTSSLNTSTAFVRNSTILTSIPATTT